MSLQDKDWLSVETIYYGNYNGWKSWCIEKSEIMMRKYGMIFTSTTSNNSNNNSDPIEYNGRVG